MVLTCTSNRPGRPVSVAVYYYFVPNIRAPVNARMLCRNAGMQECAGDSPFQQDS